MKETNKNRNLGIAVGMCLGVSMGTAFGSSYGNMGLGTSLGCAIGLILGYAIGSAKDKKVNTQVAEKGYTVQSITYNEETKEYTIVIVNHSGEETTVITPKGQMETEEFAVGDIVYLDEDGMLEQAYDKEEFL